MRSTLPKSEILRGYRSFARVLSNGRSISRSPVRLFFRFDPTLAATPKVGFSVSRSIRSAVDRNRVRRLLREAFRKNRHLMAIPPDRGGIECVFMYTGKIEGHPGLKDVEPSVRSLIEELRRT